MKTFIIDSDNDITAFATEAEAKQAATEGAPVFGTEHDLTAAATDWTGGRLVEIWNSIPGVTPVKKFTNRRVAVQRIWKAIQHLQPVAPIPARSPVGDVPIAVRQGTKRAAVLTLLSQPQGATLDEIVAAVSWQRHSVRGFLSNLNKAGIQVESFKPEGRDRAYRMDPHKAAPLAGESRRDEVQ